VVFCQEPGADSVIVVQVCRAGITGLTLLLAVLMAFSLAGVPGLAPCGDSLLLLNVGTSLSRSALAWSGCSADPVPALTGA